MHSVLANYTMPTILNSLSPAAGFVLPKVSSAKANATSTTSTSGSTSSGTSASGLGTTFLSLLAQELQNQDPTAPIDPTAMVGQMISLNQLEQLISINQGITSATSGTSTTGKEQPAAGTTPSSAALATANGGLASTLSPTVQGAATSQLPFDPVTMMPLGFGNTAAMSSAINSSLNTANIGFSGTNTNMSGGK
jgi:flagellar basal-body rod modification protein FlgD